MLRYYRGTKGANDYILCYVRIGIAPYNPLFYRLCYIDTHLKSPNIILDPIFIFVLDLGVRGAALATVLSQAVGAVWILRFLTGKKTILHLRKENFRLRRDIILPCLALGISTFVMLSTESILSISFTSSLSRYGGDLAVGAMTIITSDTSTSDCLNLSDYFLQSSVQIICIHTLSHLPISLSPEILIL